MRSANHARQYFIELIAYWEGQVNVPQVAKQFKISDSQARAAMSEYEKTAPNNLIYCTTSKAKIPSGIFKKQYISNDVADYLKWLHTGNLVIEPSSWVESLELPNRYVSPNVMRGLIQAVKRQLRVDVDYVSLTSADTEGRVIAPHAFVNTGLRWHLRAYCEKSKMYKDFVLSRFRRSADIVGPAQNTAEQDSGWNTQVTVVIQADPRLAENKKAVIERDFQMHNGRLEVVTRGCLVNYLLKDLQISTKSLELLPEAQQLICTNIKELNPWLF